MADMTLDQLQALVELQGQKIAKLEAAAAATTPAPTEYYTLTKTGEEIDEILAGGGGSANAVRYDEAQSLTTDQQAQARSNIAAAPDGFGLGRIGGQVLTSQDNLDEIKSVGSYSWRTDAPQNAEDEQYRVLNVCGLATGETVQELYVMTLNKYCKKVRMYTGTAWTPWEFVNPPMALGTEYRTTERYLGKPVYRKLIDCGNLPAPGASISVAHGVSGCRPVSITARMSNSNTIPWLGMYNIGADNVNVIINAPSGGSNLSALTAVALMRYTKSTD